MARRRVIAWLLAIPLMVVGSQVAHALAYRIVYPEAQLRAQELLATGHGYMAWTPRLLGVVLAVELLTLVNLVIDSTGERRARPVPAWAFVLLPALGFTLQEFLERLLATASFPWWMVEQPTFRIGLVLQLPFGLAAYLIARILLRAAHDVGGALRHRRAIPTARRSVAQPLGRRFRAPRVGIRGLGWSMRGPPERPA